jgi:hypothetical protein
LDSCCKVEIYALSEFAVTHRGRQTEPQAISEFDQVPPIKTVVSKNYKLSSGTVAKSGFRKIDQSGGLPHGFQSSDVANGNSHTRSITADYLQITARHRSRDGTHPQGDPTLKKRSPVVWREACVIRFRIGEMAQVVIEMAHVHRYPRK